MPANESGIWKTCFRGLRRRAGLPEGCVEPLTIRNSTVRKARMITNAYLSFLDVLNTSAGWPVCFTLPSCKTTTCDPRRMASVVLCVT